MISLNECLVLAALLFGLGIAGIIINRKHIIVLLMSIELLLPPPLQHLIGQVKR